MAEELIVAKGDKSEKYKVLLLQIRSLVAVENDLIANLANVAAVLKETFNFFWVGFYLIKETELVLGPFQGPLACTRIKYGKGVCGTAWEQSKTIIVPDVNLFPDHIACNAASQSEIVVPIVKNGKVLAVLDIDSEELNTFDIDDAQYLERLCCTILSAKFY